MPLTSQLVGTIIIAVLAFAGLTVASIAIYFSKAPKAITPVSQGGTGLTSAILGDLLYSNDTNTLIALSGNTTTSRCFLSQTGLGYASTAPTWNTLIASDVPASALTVKNNVSNLIITVTGFPNKALLAETELKLDWSGTLNVPSGGTGLSSVSPGYLLAGGSSANPLIQTQLVGTANQILITSDPGTITLSLPQNIGINLSSLGWESALQPLQWKA